jgi:hypothetical protein
MVVLEVAVLHMMVRMVMVMVELISSDWMFQELSELPNLGEEGEEEGTLWALHWGMGVLEELA